MSNDLNPLVLLCFLTVVAATTDQLAIPQSAPLPLTAEQADAKCSRYSALFSNIDADLSRWKGDSMLLPFTSSARVEG